MNLNRYYTAGLLLGLSIGIIAFTHGTRTARTTLDLAPEPLPQHQLDRNASQQNTNAGQLAKSPADGLSTGP